MEIHIKDLEALPAAAREFLKAVGSRRVFAFDAGMGAGKTTFISALCRALGVTDDVSSPTFAIVNEYRATPTETGFPDLPRRINHFDCYRIDDPAEALDFGIEDYLYSGDLCLIEWPDRIESFLPDDTVRVVIRVNPDGSRTLLME